MKKKIVLAVVVAAVVLAAAFALHRPQAGTQPTPCLLYTSDAADEL